MDPDSHAPVRASWKCKIKMYSRYNLVMHSFQKSYTPESSYVIKALSFYNHNTMNHKKSPFKLLIIILFSCFLILSNENSFAEAYKVAVLLPLSGPGASVGESIKNSIQLAFEDLSPEQKSHLVLKYEDDQLTPTKSLTIAKRLISKNDVDAFFVLGSGVANALSPVTESNKKLLVAICANDENIVKNKKYSFIHWALPATEVGVMYDEIKKREYKKLAIVATEIQGAHTLIDEFKRSLKVDGKDSLILQEEYFGMQETDFNTYLSKVIAKGVDGVVTILFPGQLSSFAKQAKALQLKANLIGIESFEDSNEIKAGEEFLVGQWFVNADSGTEEFLNKYKTKFNSFPVLASGNGYDSLRLISNAVEKNISTDGKVDNLRIVEFLNSIKDYQGVVGKYSATGDHRFDLPIVVKVVGKGADGVITFDEVYN